MFRKFVLYGGRIGWAIILLAVLAFVVIVVLGSAAG